MAVPDELIAQFAKVVKEDKTTNKNESIVYGTIQVDGVSRYVLIDGSSTPTPVSSTIDVNDHDRVTVMIKNHTAIVTGNMSHPAATADDVNTQLTAMGNKLTEFENIVADTVSTEQFEAEVARIDEVLADVVTTEKLDAFEADITNLQAEDVTIKNQLTVQSASIESLNADKLSVSVATTTYATIESLNATNADINTLEADHAEFKTATADKFTAVDASIESLKTDKLSAEEAMITYANIDFSNIGQAAMEYFYANSGLIENVVVSNGTITGALAGVTIRGDLIEANTLVADKLVIHGEDGLYYKLNTNGETISTEQTEYNSLNGRVILAKSITAEKVNVDDLVAFDATIGGFNITENAIFSEVKDSEDNVTRGIYMDTDGQVNFGDADNFIKYYRTEDGNYKLAISADTILYTLDGKQRSISDLGVVGEYVRISTYEGEPSIELGESDSDFKLRITNTRMIFTEGTVTLAYFNNQSLHITKAVIEEELQQGEFVWKARSNGNLGLIWKGGN